jgi:hypothetical protein
MEDREKKESREIKSENITSYYNDSGKMTKVTVIKNGEILLKSETDHTMIMSDLIEIYLNEDTGKIMRVSIPSPGRIENTGKTEFRVTAAQMNADYNQAGELAYCEGRGNTDFTIDDYRGIAGTLLYDIEKNDIALAGENAQIINKDNTFNSTRFSVDTEEKILSSTQGVKSVILLNKKNVLFSSAPIFINAKEFNMERSLYLSKTKVIAMISRPGRRIMKKITKIRKIKMTLPLGPTASFLMQRKKISILLAIL